MTKVTQIHHYCSHDYSNSHLSTFIDFLNHLFKNCNPTTSHTAWSQICIHMWLSPETTQSFVINCFYVLQRWRRVADVMSHVISYHILGQVSYHVMSSQIAWYVKYHISYHVIWSNKNPKSIFSKIVQPSSGHDWLSWLVILSFSKIQKTSTKFFLKVIYRPSGHYLLSSLIIFSPEINLLENSKTYSYRNYFLRIYSLFSCHFKDK